MRALPLEIEWIDAEGEEAAEKLLFSPWIHLSLQGGGGGEGNAFLFLGEEKR